jgi:hypothetical protein
MIKQGLCKECYSPGRLMADRDKPLEQHEWLTGRNLPWGGGPEVITIQVYPIVRKDLCYYHEKKRIGLIPR